MSDFRPGLYLGSPLSSGCVGGCHRWRSVSDYGTVAFELNTMHNQIHLCYDAIDLWAWMSKIPIQYQEDALIGATKLYPQGNPATEKTLVVFIQSLHEWILCNIEPTNDPRPRSRRWASAWADIGVRAALDRRLITRHQAQELLHQNSL